MPPLASTRRTVGEHESDSGPPRHERGCERRALRPVDFLLFVFAYVDIFGFWRADLINGALVGRVPGPGFEINQPLLVFTTIYILIPGLMVIVSLLAPAQMNRTTNIVVSLTYLASVVVSIVGETWIYFILGSVVEVMLLLAIARVAWTWPRRPAQ
jgi:hypothetical protein